jgi:titin
MLVQNLDALTYADNNRVKGNTYTYLVLAKNTQGSATGVYASALIGNTVSDAPPALAKTLTATTANLSWAVPADLGNGGPVSYDVYVDGEKKTIAPISEQSYQVTGLTRATTYEIKVVAVNSVGDSDPLTENITTLTDKPGEAGSPVATALDGGRSISLAWNAPADNGGLTSLSYKVYTLTNVLGGDIPADSANWALATVDTVSAGTAFTKENLAKGANYAFKITAVNAVGESVGVVVPGATLTTAPSAVTDLIADEDTQSVTLEWSKPTAANMGGHSALSYKIYAAPVHVTGLDNAAFVYKKTVTATSLASVSETVDGLSKGTNYTFKVVPVGTTASEIEQEGTGALVQTTTLTTAPGDVTGLASAADSNGTSVSLEWTAPADNGGEASVSYSVYKKEGSAFVSVTTGLTQTEYVVNGLNKNTEYTFKVVAVNVTGSSAGVVTTIATPATAPSNVTGPAANVNGTNVSLSWNATADIGAFGVTPLYKVYRRTVATGENGGKGELLTAAPISELTYEDTGLSKGITYTYTIVVSNGTADSTGATASAPILKTAPSSARNLAVSGTAATVNLTWNEPTDKGGYTGGAAGDVAYKVYRANGLIASAGDTAWGTATVLEGTGITDTEYEDTGLTLGLTYTYKVVATTASGDSAGVISDITLAAAAPSSVRNLTSEALVANEEVLLGWSIPANVPSPVSAASLYYRIYRLDGAVTDASSVDFGMLTPISNAYRPTVTDETDVAYTASISGRGKVYTFAVLAYNSAGDADVVLSAPVNLPLETPGVPEDFEAEVASGVPGVAPSVTLSWNSASDIGDDRDGASLKYKLYRIESGDVTAPAYSDAYTLIATVTGNEYVDNGVAKNKNYWYLAVAENAADDSFKSAYVSDSAAIVATAPTAVTSLTAGAVSYTTLNFSWSAPTDNGGSPISGYKTEYKMTSEDSWTVFTASQAELAASITGLEYGTSYDFRVSAINVAGASAPQSISKSTMADAAPSSVLSLSSELSNDDVLLGWTIPAIVGGSASSVYYRIYQLDGAVTDVSSVDFSELTPISNAYRPNAPYTDAAYTVSAPGRGKTFTYAVLAYNAAGDAQPVLTVPVTMPLRAPGAPEDFEAEVSSVVPGAAPSVTLSWNSATDKGDDRDGASLKYKLYRIESGDVMAPAYSDAYTLIATVTGNEYVDNDALKNKNYWYLAVAENAADDSFKSAYVSDSAAIIATVPSAVTSLTAGDVSYTSLNFSWSAPADNGGSPISGYKTEYKKTSEDSWTVFSASQTELATSISVPNQGLEYGTSYDFRVSAINGEGLSAPQSISKSTLDPDELLFGAGGTEEAPETGSAAKIMEIVTSETAKENYPAAAVEAYEQAVLDAIAALSDDSLTPIEVENLLGVVKTKLADLVALEQDHPLIAEESELEDILETGKTVSAAFKGVFDSVDMVIISAAGIQNIELTPVSTVNPEIKELRPGDAPDAIKVGTLTKGSAIVNLDAAYLDTFANGTYTIMTHFKHDGFKDGEGSAIIKINRTSVDPPKDPEDDPAQVPEDDNLKVPEDDQAPAPAAVTHKITFKPGKGKLVSGSAKSKTVTESKKYGKLPNAKRTGYKFKGWYTKKSGGKKIIAATIVTVKKNQKLYAHWKKQTKKAKQTKKYEYANLKKGIYVLRIHERPLKDSPVIGWMEKDQTIRITGKVDRAGTNSDWYKIKYKGKTSYIHASFVKTLSR